MIRQRRLGRLLLAVLAMTIVTTGPAPADDYAAGSTFVARAGSTTAVDIGLVECNAAPQPSVGGACIPWAAGGSAIEVVEDDTTMDVAFQVCVDNDGDSFCGGTPTIAGCDDVIVFSHFDDGSFSNPLAAPTSFTSGCPGGFPGWVVFLCQGTHVTGTPHTHDVTTGTIASASSGGPSGTFCGAPLGKPYVRPTIPQGCFGAGSMTTGSALHLATLGPADTTNFVVQLSFGSCLPGGTISAWGTITGSCFAATGTGVFSTGHAFTLTWAGAPMQLVPSGPAGAAGTLAVVPNSSAGESCTTGADGFIVAGTFVLP